MRDYLLSQLEGYILKRHIHDARYVDYDDVSLFSKDEQGKNKSYVFKIKRTFWQSESATVRITMYDDTIRTIYCNCSEFGRLHSCCHIPAAIMNSDVFEEMERDSKSISKIILNNLT